MARLHHWSRVVLVGILMLLTATSNTGRAEGDSNPKITRYFSQLNVIRLNPLGLDTQNKAMIQRKLMDSDSILFSNTFLGGGLSMKLNPAYVKIGPLLDFQPIALFNLKVGYEYMYFWNNLGPYFGYVQSWEDPIDPQAFADEVRDVNTEDGLAYSTAGHHFFIEPTLQAKAGPIAVRAKFAIEWWNMNVNEGDTVWYDATLDTFVPARGWVWANDTDVLYLTGGKATIGLRLSTVHPFFTDANFPVTADNPEGGEPVDFAGASHLRVGPLFAYSLKKDPTGSSHTLLSILGWYLNHPNRADSAMPYILVGYSYRRGL